MTIYIPYEVMLGVPILFLGVILISFPADDDIQLLIRFFMVILFFCLTACTSSPKPTLTDCTRSKLKLDVQLNGVGPEEIEKINQVTKECLGEGR